MTTDRDGLVESNEGLALRRLSDALTGGAAGTWDEVFHAAEQAADAISRPARTGCDDCLDARRELQAKLDAAIRERDAAADALSAAHLDLDTLRDRHGTLQGVAVLRLERAERAEAKLEDALSAAQRLVEEMRALESYVLGSPERRAWTNACRTCAAKLEAALLSERSPRPATTPEERPR